MSDEEEPAPAVENKLTEKEIAEFEALLKGHYKRRYERYLAEQRIDLDEKVDDDEKNERIIRSLNAFNLKLESDFDLPSLFTEYKKLIIEEAEFEKTMATISEERVKIKALLAEQQILKDDELKAMDARRQDLEDDLEAELKARKPFYWIGAILERLAKKKRGSAPAEMANVQQPKTVIHVAEQFSRFPVGRTNGASFRDSYLLPALQENDVVVVDFDGVVGLPSSFLEEAFGGLVRMGAIESLSGFSEKLKIIADQPNIHRAAELIKRYVFEALKNNPQSV